MHHKNRATKSVTQKANYLQLERWHSSLMSKSRNVIAHVTILLALCGFLYRCFVDTFFHVVWLPKYFRVHADY